MIFLLVILLIIKNLYLCSLTPTHILIKRIINYKKEVNYTSIRTINYKT